jgi:hypothetical protein
VSKRNGKQRHFNVLVRSTQDDVMLGEAVQAKFLDLCGSHQRIRFEELPIPPSLDGDLFRWRTMVARHRTGDNRHTEAEKRSVRTVAEWLVAENAKLRNQKQPAIEWKD